MNYRNVRKNLKLLKFVFPAKSQDNCAYLWTVVKINETNLN